MHSNKYTYTYAYIYILTQLFTQQNAPGQLLIARPVTHPQYNTHSPFSITHTIYTHTPYARHIHTYTTQNSEAPEKLRRIRHPRRLRCCCSRKRLYGGGPPYWRLATACRADSGFNEPCVHVCYCITVHNIYILYMLAA